MESNSPPGFESGFQNGLHYNTRPANTLTRLGGRLIRILTSIATRAPFLGRIDLETIAIANTEHILNLPGMLPFYPTKATKLARVQDLLRQLYPILSNRALIRLGPVGDGGYLVPDDLADVEACFSPGVSDVAGFERHCAELGMKVFMADASVEGPPDSHPQFHFLHKFVGSVTQGHFVSLTDWVNASLPGSTSDLLLQIDIEGYEYETFLGIPESLLQRFRIIVVEFHNLDYLFSDPIFTFYSRAFEKILLTHSCVHIHPNNMCGFIKIGNLEIPQLAEFTFLRNDRITKRVFATTFPHPLDADNGNRPTAILPHSCYAHDCLS